MNGVMIVSLQIYLSFSKGYAKVNAGSVNRLNIIEFIMIFYAVCQLLFNNKPGYSRVSQQAYK